MAKTIKPHTFTPETDIGSEDLFGWLHENYEVVTSGHKLLHIAGTSDTIVECGGMTGTSAPAICGKHYPHNAHGDNWVIQAGFSGGRAYSVCGECWRIAQENHNIYKYTVCSDVMRVAFGEEPLDFDGLAPDQQKIIEKLRMARQQKTPLA